MNQYSSEIQESSSFFSALSMEVKQLARILQPRPEETELRRWIVHQFQRLCQTVLWPDEEVMVEPYGSYATGIYLPEGDIDMCVRRRNGSLECLMALQQHFIKNKCCWIDVSSVKLISSAKIPVLKLRTHSRFGYIALDVTSSPASTEAALRAAAMVRQWEVEFPLLRQLALTVKYFVRLKRVDEVYTGGLGGYAIMNMLVAILRQRQTIDHSMLTPSSLGRSFFCFFEAFALRFDYQSQAILATGEGFIPRPHEFIRIPYSSSNGSLNNTRSNMHSLRFWDDELLLEKELKHSNDSGYASSTYANNNNMYGWSDYISLYIQDPADASNNISKASFNMPKIRNFFSQMFYQLEASRQDFPATHRTGLQDVFWRSDGDERRRDTTVSHWIGFCQVREAVMQSTPSDADFHQILPELVDADNLAIYHWLNRTPLSEFAVPSITSESISPTSTRWSCKNTRDKLKPSHRSMFMDSQDFFSDTASTRNKKVVTRNTATSPILATTIAASPPSTPEKAMAIDGDELLQIGGEDDDCTLFSFGGPVILSPNPRNSKRAREASISNPHLTSDSLLIARSNIRHTADEKSLDFKMTSSNSSPFKKTK